MSKRPWMKLYVQDFVADTEHLNAAQTGAYFLLICSYWTRGNLPRSDAELARIARMTPVQWRRNKPIVSAFFSSDWKHKRVESELAKVRDVSEKRRASAVQMHMQKPCKPDANAAQNSGAHSAANAPALAQQVHTDSDSERKKEKKEAPSAQAPKALAAHANFFSEAAPADEPPQARLFRVGRVILISLGIAERRTGPLLGQWLKQTHNDHAGLLGALEYARDHAPADPISYVTALLSKGKPNGKPKTLADRARELADEAREREHAANIRRADDGQ